MAGSIGTIRSAEAYEDHGPSSSRLPAHASLSHATHPIALNLLTDSAPRSFRAFDPGGVAAHLSSIGPSARKLDCREAGPGAPDSRQVVIALVSVIGRSL